MVVVPDVMVATKKVSKLLLENDMVRAMEFSIKPGGKAPMHNHPNDHFVYFLTDTKLKVTDPEGKSQDIKVKSGQSIWMAAGSHEAVNMGKTETRYLAVELKLPSQEAASLSDSS